MGEIEQQERIIEGQLIAPCCFMQTLDNHSSPKADEMKREIRSQLDSGWSPSQIVQGFVDRYGERILAVPQASGFNLFAYLVPIGFISSAMVACGVWVRRARRRYAQPGRSATARTDYDAALCDRIRAELATFD